MKWGISYAKRTTGKTMFYSQDNELNSTKALIEASSKEEALNIVKLNITELMFRNCHVVESLDDEIIIYEPRDHDFIESYYDFSATRVYLLLDKNGEKYYSLTPGTIGGHKKLKIYGKLDCPSALRHIANGNYVKYRVFFADEDTAITAGYRPCGICMKENYKKWKTLKQKTTNNEEI